MADRIDNLGDKKHKLTADDASKGGKKSGQVRRDKRDIKELARADRRSTEGAASLGQSNAITILLRAADDFGYKNSALHLTAKRCF